MHTGNDTLFTLHNYRTMTVINKESSLYVWWHNCL